MALKVCCPVKICSNAYTFSDKVPVGTIVLINLVRIVRMMCICEMFPPFEHC